MARGLSLTRRPGSKRPASGMALALSLALGLVLSAGCGRSLRLDSQQLESLIPAALAPDAPDAVRAVDCPDVIVGGSTTVACTANIGGDPIDVSVVLTPDDRALVSTDAVLIDVAEMEADAAQRLSDDVGVQTTVTCAGERVLVTVPGKSLRCAAIDPDGRAHDVTLTIRSGDGRWDMTIG